MQFPLEIMKKFWRWIGWRFAQQSECTYLKIFYIYLHLSVSERQRETAQAGEGRKNEIQIPKEAPGSELSAQSPTQGSNP